jgi:hypothetical protein
MEGTLINEFPRRVKLVAFRSPDDCSTREDNSNFHDIFHLSRKDYVTRQVAIDEHTWYSRPKYVE